MLLFGNPSKHKLPCSQLVTLSAYKLQGCRLAGILPGNLNIALQISLGARNLWNLKQPAKNSSNLPVPWLRCEECYQCHFPSLLRAHG